MSRNLFLAIIVCSFVVSGCAHESLEPTPVWTRSALFGNYVSIVTKPPSTREEFIAVDGADVFIAIAAFEFVKNEDANGCRGLEFRDHYAFYKREDDTMTVIIEPAFIPAPESVSGVTQNPDGTQRVRVVAIDGATRLLGCFGYVQTQDEGRTFVPLAQ